MADLNPQYLVWAVGNIPWFDLDAAARKEAQRRIDSARAKQVARSYGAPDYGDDDDDRDCPWGGLTDDDMSRD